MLPELAEHGLLPPGVHSATWEQFAERFIVFDRSDRRLRIGERIRALYDEIRSSKITRRFLIAGSFVSSAAEPNDFDCLLVLDPAIVGMTLAPFQYNLISRRRTRKTYQGDIVAVLDNSAAFSEYLEFFQTTRDGRQVGMVEITI